MLSTPMPARIKTVLVWWTRRDAVRGYRGPRLATYCVRSLNSGMRQPGSSAVAPTELELLVPVEVARRLLLEPQAVVLGRLLEEVRRLLQHVLVFARPRAALRGAARAPRRRGPRRAPRRATGPRRSRAPRRAGGSSAMPGSPSGSSSTARLERGGSRLRLVGCRLARLRLGLLGAARAARIRCAGPGRAPPVPGARHPPDWLRACV